jgi:putative oxidoreductase
VNREATLPLLARLLMSAIFLVSGVGKLASPAATLGYIAAMGLPLPQLGLVFAIVAEIGGGLALLAGYRTRFAAAGLALFCVATAAIFHNSFGDQNQFIHFMKNLAMAGGLLQVAAFGAGDFSVDEWKRGGRR